MQLRVVHMLTVSIKSDVHYSIAPCIVPTFFVLFNFDLRRWNAHTTRNSCTGKNAEHWAAIELNAKYRNKRNALKDELMLKTTRAGYQWWLSENNRWILARSYSKTGISLTCWSYVSFGIKDTLKWTDNTMYLRMSELQFAFRHIQIRTDHCMSSF